MNNLIFTIRQICDGLEIYADDELSPYLEKRIAELRTYCEAYDSLAPDWSQAPDGAQWYTIDSDGNCHWHETEPFPCVSWYESGTADFAGFSLVIPLGVDWRLCKWQRPEVTP